MFRFNEDALKGILFAHWFGVWSALFMSILVNVMIWSFCFPATVYAYTIASGPVTDTDHNRSGTLQWSLDSNGTMTFTGVGPGVTYRPCGVPGYDALCPWDSYRSSIKKVQFNCRFEGTSLYHLNYGASINSWFVDCINLEEVSNIPAGITDMCATFLNCKKLKKVGSIPDSVVSMQYTFCGCESLEYPTNLPSGLREDCYFMKNNEIVHVQAIALGETFENCFNLKTTPDFSRCLGANELLGTFYNCTSLQTIQKIPANITIFLNSFNNCSSVRGVFASDATKVEIIGTPFENFSKNNSYLLFVKSKDSTLFQTIKNQSGAGFRGYIWNDYFDIQFNTNGGNALSNRKIRMEYGSNLANDIDSNYRTQINASYYDQAINSLGNLPTPTRSNYAFVGWFYDSALTKKAEKTDIINPTNEELNTKKRTLYAAWKEGIKPTVTLKNVDSDWHNKPITINVKVTENKEGGIKYVQLIDKKTNSVVYKKDYTSNGILSHDFNYTIGNVEQKLYEGTTNWQIIAEDFSGNKTVVDFLTKLDYTPPRIKTDSIYDKGDELIYDDREKARIWAEDDLSGVVLLKVNPSNMQNTFIDPITTPVKQEAVFQIDYVYPEDKKIYGYAVLAKDRAGNIFSRAIITQDNLVMHTIRVVPRENYD